jgi:hypothetical protein
MTRDKRFRNNFTPEEQKLIRQLGNMRSAVNVLRTLGKLMPRSALSLGGGAAAGYYVGDPKAVGGLGARHGRASCSSWLDQAEGETGFATGTQRRDEPHPRCTAAPAAAAIFAAQAATLPWRNQQ